MFCYHCAEYTKLDTCAKFHDYRSNNNKVMIGGALCPPPPITDGSKKPMSNMVKSDWLIENAGINRLNESYSPLVSYSTI